MRDALSGFPDPVSLGEVGCPIQSLPWSPPSLRRVKQPLSQETPDLLEEASPLQWELPSLMGGARLPDKLGQDCRRTGRQLHVALESLRTERERRGFNRSAPARVQPRPG